LALTSLLLLVDGARAQDSEDAQETISGKAAFGYLATQGNTDSTNVNAALKLVYALTNWSHDFDLSAVAATNNEETNAEAYSGKYAARRSYGESSFLFTTLDWQRDRFSAYDEQVSESVGYGRRLIDRERHDLSVEIGVGARQSQVVDGTEQDEAIARGAVNYEFALNDTTNFTQDFSVESGSSNTNIQAVSALRARLFGDIALVLSYRLKHNSVVPDGRENMDSYSSISLEYAF
jgi:putative salt-induced outer membrane protein